MIAIDYRRRFPNPVPAAKPPTARLTASGRFWFTYALVVTAVLAYVSASGYVEAIRAVVGL